MLRQQIASNSTNRCSPSSAGRESHSSAEISSTSMSRPPPSPHRGRTLSPCRDCPGDRQAHSAPAAALSRRRQQRCSPGLRFLPFSDQLPCMDQLVIRQLVRSILTREHRGIRRFSLQVPALAAGTGWIVLLSPGGETSREIECCKKRPFRYSPSTL